jgi:hypothetical protein
MPIFEFTDIKIEEDHKNVKNLKFYEFSNANIKKFVAKLEIDLTGLKITKKFLEFTEMLQLLHLMLQLLHLVSCYSYYI